MELAEHITYIRDGIPRTVYYTPRNTGSTGPWFGKATFYDEDGNITCCRFFHENQPHGDAAWTIYSDRYDPSEENYALFIFGKKVRYPNTKEDQVMLQLEYPDLRFFGYEERLQFNLPLLVDKS